MVVVQAMEVREEIWDEIMEGSGLGGKLWTGERFGGVMLRREFWGYLMAGRWTDIWVVGRV